MGNPQIIQNWLLYVIVDDMMNGFFKGQGMVRWLMNGQFINGVLVVVDNVLYFFVTLSVDIYIYIHI